MGDRSTTPRILGARHDRQRDMRPMSKVVETVRRPRTSGHQTGGQKASTSADSRRGIAGKNSRDPASELRSSTQANRSRNSIRRRPFNSVEFLCIRGSTRYGLRATDVKARQNRTLQYLRALIAVNFVNWHPRPDRRCGRPIPHAKPCPVTQVRTRDIGRRSCVQVEISSRSVKIAVTMPRYSLSHSQSLS